MSINKAILIGNLGGDPDVKVFNDGAKIATISLATSERWTDKQTGEKRENTEWHKVVFNNRLAEIAEQYLRKGSKVYVEGAIKTRKYTDKQGIERYTTEIKASVMQMLDSKSDGNSNTHQGGYGNTQNGYQDGYQGDYQNGYQDGYQGDHQNIYQGYQDSQDHEPQQSYSEPRYDNAPSSHAPSSHTPPKRRDGFKEMETAGKAISVPSVQDEEMPF